MAPERPRSAAFDVPLAPRIIERKPESEVREFSIPKRQGRSKRLTIGLKFRDLFRPAMNGAMRPRSFLRRVEPELVEPELVEPAYLELREPRHRRPPPLRAQRPPLDEFVPLPPAVPSPRRRPEEETHVLETRSPRERPILHPPSTPRREHRRHRTPSPPSIPFREVETIRIRRLDRTDRGKAERQRARDVEEEVRIERERRHDVEDNCRHLADIAMHERSERHRMEREMLTATAQRRSAEITAADLQRENDLLDRARRLAEREVELDRERERERERTARGRPEDEFRPLRDVLLPAREPPRRATDRGADIIQAARNARHQQRAERIFYYDNGRRIDPHRRD